MNDYTCTCDCGCKDSSAEYICHNCKTGSCSAVSAYVLINCDAGKLDDVMKEVNALDNVKEVQETCGAYDIIARIESITSVHLQKCIVHKIRNLKNVRSSMTLRCRAIRQ